MVLPLLRALVCLLGIQQLSRAHDCRHQPSSKWVCHLEHSFLLHQQIVLMAFVLSQHCLLWPGRLESLDLSLQILACSSFQDSLQGLDIILSKQTMVLRWQHLSCHILVLFLVVQHSSQAPSRRSLILTLFQAQFK